MQLDVVLSSNSIVLLGREVYRKRSLLNCDVPSLLIIACGTILSIPVPPRPQNVVVSRLDSTTIAVSWTKLTLVELKGLASYVITYNVIIPTRKKQEFRGMTNVSWMESSVFLSNLQPGAQYDVTVSIVTSAGTSGTYRSISTRLSEGYHSMMLKFSHI